MTTCALKIGLLWRGDADAPPPVPAETRFRHIFEEFKARGLVAEPVVYAEEAHDLVRERIFALDGVLVWVDPIVAGRERTRLDHLLRDAADRGVFVSTHPDVIDAMGTKEVLYRTRDMPWGTNTDVYRGIEELREGLSTRLSSGASWVLKQDRGSSGNGVWKVEVDGSAARGSLLRVQSAERNASIEKMTLDEFIERRAPYFLAFIGTGCFVGQPYAERLADGMVRCYMVHDRVAGFGHQYVTALLPLASTESVVPAPSPRLYYGRDKAEFQALRVLLESAWLKQLQYTLGVDTDSLPVVWDADFLLGPKDGDGNDTYVLCEVNVSGVFPIPDETIAPLVEAAIRRSTATKQ